MLGRIQRSLVIEQAFVLWEQEVQLSFKPLFNKLPFPEQAQVRESLRKMQSEFDCKVHDIAVCIATFFLAHISDFQRNVVGGVVWEWKRRKLLNEEIFKLAREHLAKYGA